MANGKTSNSAPIGSLALTTIPGWKPAEATLLWGLLAAGATLALVFQVGHFAEHAVQFFVWLFDASSRGSPWMSPVAMSLIHQIGVRLFPDADAARQMMLGMEVLHLIGNSIFLAGLIAACYLAPSKYIRWAFYIEGFHLCEHISLTLTSFYLGKPIGISTLFGEAGALGGREFAVGFRVSWHFAMNLLPMPLAMLGLMRLRHLMALCRHQHS